MRNYLTPFSTFALALTAFNWNIPSAFSMNDHLNPLSQERIEREKEQAAQRENTRPIAEALSAVEETRAAVKMLENNRNDQARAALERAIGKMDIVLAAHPNLALVPVSADIHVVDMAADEATIKRINDEAKDLVNKGLYQSARLLLRDLASEIDIAIVNLPIVSYPTAIHQAVRLIDEGKSPEARLQLLTALNSLVIAETTIPIPIVRAQAFVDEASRQVDSGKFDRNQTNQLLTEADQQLNLAEKLGYGMRKQDYTDLASSIKTARNSLNKGQDTRSLLTKLKQDLEGFKARLVKTAKASV